LKKSIVKKSNDYRQAAIKIIDQQSTLTLATAEDNCAWAAPVYYVFYKSAFFFFSNPDSKHIRQAMANDQVAATIHPHSTTWQGIKGLQMSGKVSSVRPGLTGIQAVRAYVGKFPFIRDFFEDGQAMDLISFSKRFRANLYCFTPQLVYYLDNTVRFGFRAEVNL
jgi:uncharacterized protein YhbP (UPF0306 family)